jgi:Uma2 family endonuclease
MVQHIEIPSTAKPIIYPENDGNPMSENTEQYQWLVLIKENLEIWFAAVANVFIAGDLLWYPVEGNNKLSAAPDVMVAIGRPKQKRGSYKQWEEENIPPQVVFEILSPANTQKEMAAKLLFYQKYGVEEYYIYNPEKQELTGLCRSGDWLEPIDRMQGWVSPRLGIRFEMTEETLEIYRPDDRKFLTSVELAARVEQAEAEAERERQRAEQTEIRMQRLEARLRELGIDPNGDLD